MILSAESPSAASRGASAARSRSSPTCRCG